VSGNSAGRGGGIFNHYYSDGPITLTNSTVSGNSASQEGGGIFNYYEPVTLTNSTVTGNSAGEGGGIFSVSGPVTLTSTIVANSPSGGNCAGGDVPTDGGNNFADDDTCGPGFADITPDLDFDTNLADNGGPTQTHALFPGSVAIDAAGDCGLETDQRGILRDDGACDSGSFEFRLCGNGIIDPIEECDDGDNVSCDGCSAICEHEMGFVCGDGGLNTDCGEECDDGNNEDGDGCASDCTLEEPVPAVSYRGVFALVVLFVTISTAVLLWRRRLVA
jgi:cysteine-rich repeat protein